MTTIRPARETDSKSFRALVSELGYELDERTAARNLRTYLDSSESVILFAFDGNDTAAGMISGHVIPLVHERGHLGRITALVVRDDYRRNGTGSALLDRLQEWFGANECGRLEVTSSGRRTGAHKFYRACGFADDERRFIKRLQTEVLR